MLSPERIGRITASRAGQILGVSPFANRKKCMAEMLAEAKGLPKAFNGNAATQYGNDNESVGLDIYRSMYGEARESRFYIHPVYDWLGATPDAETDIKTIEIKSPYKKQMFLLCDREDYYLQVQLQMFCTGKLLADFIVYDGMSIEVEEVEFNLEYINGVIPILKHFYDEYLEALKASVEPEKETAAKTYIYLEEQIRELKAKQDEVKSKLLEGIETDKVLVGGLQITKTIRTGGFDTSKFIKDNEIVIPDTYKKVDTEYYTIRIAS